MTSVSNTRSWYVPHVIFSAISGNRGRDAITEDPAGNLPPRHKLVPGKGIGRGVLHVPSMD